jgi:hypothetical protein
VAAVVLRNTETKYFHIWLLDIYLVLKTICATIILGVKSGRYVIQRRVEHRKLFVSMDGAFSWVLGVQSTLLLPCGSAGRIMTE